MSRASSEGDHFDDIENEPNLSYNTNFDKINRANSANKGKKSHNSNDTDQLPIETTDYMVEYLADGDKLISENQRWVYDGSKLSDSRQSFHEQDQSYHNDDDDDNDNNLDDYYTNGTNHGGNDQKTDNFTSQREETDTNANTDTKKEKKEEKLTQEELMLKKLDILSKLVELKKAGVIISQNYNMNSDLKTMTFEYELHKNIRAKQNSVNWMSSMTLNGIYALEMLNEKYDPFSIKLKGWSEQMNADVENYYDVFSDLYDKYNKPGKAMAPEIKLMLMISGSALKFHLGHTVMNNLPSLAGALANNPELGDKIRQQAIADKMKEQSIKHNEKLNEKFNKEHTQVAQKASDLQMLKEKELEYLKTKQQGEQQHIQYEELRQKLQQMQNNNNNTNQNNMNQNNMNQNNMNQNMNQNNNNNSNIMNQNMNQNNSNNMNQQQLRPPQIPTGLNKLYSNPQNTSNFVPQNQNQNQNQNLNGITQAQFEEFKKQQLMNQYLYMQQLQSVKETIGTASETEKSSKYSNTRSSKKSISQEEESTVSSIKINPNFDDIIKKTKSSMLEKTRANVTVETIDSDEVSKSLVSVGNKSKGSKNSSKKKGIKINI
jgi:hypothetical protein